MSEKIGQGFKAFLPRLVPATEEKESTISNSTLAFIAVAVALVVVVVSVTVYSKYGIETQYQENIQLAMEAFNSANAAANAGDVAEARRSWELTIEYVKRAERYRRASDSQTLRLQAQSMLDTLDSVVRLDFRSALLVGWDKSVEVALMAATETDLYLLNATRGNVMRAFITNQGYEVDPSFKCEPGLYGDYQVGELIDMVALPRVNAFDAAVLVMDGNGTLLYCAPEVEPHPVLLAAPELGWRGLAGFTLDTDSKNLYVLDPSASRVWVYSGDLVNFLDPPFSFFGEQVPKNMGTVIDLAANGEDLYLLFQDGHVTRCTMREVAPTSCSDQVMIDTRLQHQSGATISDAIFTRIFFASPPDPSLYMFEPNSQAIYRFSPRPDGLFLQGQFRAAAEMVKKQFTTAASAVAISPNHYFFLCIGNQVYYATDVP